MAEESSSLLAEAMPWQLGVFDAHCHPTDTVPSMDKVPAMKTRALTIMATRTEDQPLVADFATRFGISSDSQCSINSEKITGHIIPCFGWHPWFSHQIYDDTSYARLQTVNKAEHYEQVIIPSPKDDHDFIASLPDPRPLSTLIEQTRSYLALFPLAMVGEIGLDRAFRIPGLGMVDKGYERDPALTPGGREGRRLSPYRVDIDHQKSLLKAQLNLAGEMGRAVSVHGVAAHGIVYETIQETWRGHEKRALSKRERKRKPSVDASHEGGGLPKGSRKDSNGPKPFPPRICLHSYSGPPDIIQQYLHASTPTVIYFSFSCLVNFSPPTSKKAVNVIKAVPDDRILAESDLHAAGEKMDDLLEEIIRKICEIKQWPLEKGVKQLSSNWMSYVFGDA